MISKPPQTNSKDLDSWFSELLFEIGNRLRSDFFPVSPLGTGAAALHGKHSTRNLTAGTQTAYMEMVVPWTLREFKEVGIRIIPTTTGSIDYTVNLSYGGVGEDENNLTKTVSVTGKAVTDDQVMELDITPLFTDQDHGDQVGVEFVLDGLTTTTSIHVLGLFLKNI